jgi:hypothetical protein
MNRPAVLLAATLGMVGLLAGAVLAFGCATSSIPPGRELGLIGAAIGIGVGLLGAGIGLFVGRSSSRRAA